VLDWFSKTVGIFESIFSPSYSSSFASMSIAISGEILLWDAGHDAVGVRHRTVLIRLLRIRFLPRPYCFQPCPCSSWLFSYTCSSWPFSCTCSSWPFSCTCQRFRPSPRPANRSDTDLELVRQRGTKTKKRRRDSSTDSSDSNSEPRDSANKSLTAGSKRRKKTSEAYQQAIEIEQESVEHSLLAGVAKYEKRDGFSF